MLAGDDDARRASRRGTVVELGNMHLEEAMTHGRYIGSVGKGEFRSITFATAAAAVTSIISIVGIFT